MNYQHKISARAKRITIKLSPDGTVIVTSPKYTPKILINHLINKNKAWIEQQRQKSQQHQFITDQVVTIFAKDYQKKTLITNKFGIYIQDNQIQFCALDNNKQPAQLHLNKFLKNTATKYIIPRTHQLAEKMSLQFKRISIREQSTRWGSCSSNKNLNFNWRLVHFATEVIDYVIVHELSHLQHLNHSPAFWQLVAKFDPAYPLHRGILKRYHCV